MRQQKTPRYQLQICISTPDNVPALVTSPVNARNGIRNNDPGTPAFASRRVGPRKGK
jgi:hypothetical protein